MMEDKGKKRESEIINVDTYTPTNKGVVAEVVGSNASNNTSSTGKNNQAFYTSVKGGSTNPPNEDGQKKMPNQNSKKLKVNAVRATKISSAPLDPCLPANIKSSYHVLGMGDDNYDAILTQTNVEEDSNEFYVIQVLEANLGNSYLVYNRWGSVGQDGETRFSGPLYSCDSAVQEFEEIFYEKTKNHWSDRKNFVPYPKCHTWLEVDYRKKDQGEASNTRAVIHARSTHLERRVAKLMSLIFNVNIMKQQMTEIGYNAEKLPLHNLSESTILKGYEVLKVIDEVFDIMGQYNRKLLEELSGEFYTIIPHDFGGKKLSEFVIDTPKKLRSKVEMVEALGGIEEAARLAAGIGLHEDPLFAQFETLHCRIVPVEPMSKEFSMIENYMKVDSQATHTHLTPDVFQIFKVSREGENERFEKYARSENRMLLWHGSRLTNWVGILSQGLRIAPDQVPTTGASLGRGIYFSDMFAKSIAYCYTTSTTTDAILCLCEVALGDMQESSGYQTKISPGRKSVKAAGNTAPSKSIVLEDGLVVPQGPVKKTSTVSSRIYSEYVVFNVDQVRIRYIVQVLKFKSGNTVKK